MRLAAYYPNSTVDGVGVRQVFWAQGCEHHCKGCHNPSTWTTQDGFEMLNEEIVYTALKSPYNVTFSGGDPLYQISDLTAICELIAPLKTIWVYTGFTWEEVVNSEYKIVLPHIDVLVDGKFVEALKDPKLPFRGSSNQRLIDVKKSLNSDKVVLYER